MRSARAHLPKPRKTICSAIVIILRHGGASRPGTRRRLLPGGAYGPRRPALAPLYERTLVDGSAEERVVVGIRRNAHAEDEELARTVVLERVPGARRDEDGAAGPDPSRLPVGLQRACPLRDEVDLLGQAVVMAFRGLTGLESRLREALHGRVVQLPDRRAVLRREGLDVVEALQVHRAGARTSATRCWGPGSIPVKKGSASERELTSSATGQSPSSKPKRSTMYGCRWIDG